MKFDTDKQFLDERKPLIEYEDKEVVDSFVPAKEARPFDPNKEILVVRVEL